MGTADTISLSPITDALTSMEAVKAAVAFRKNTRHYVQKNKQKKILGQRSALSITLCNFGHFTVVSKKQFSDLLNEHDCCPIGISHEILSLEALLNCVVPP